MQQTNRKPLIIGGAIAAALLLGAAVMVILYLAFWIGPSKQDFTDASVKAKEITKHSGSKLLAEYTTKVSAQYRAGKSGEDLQNVAGSEKAKLTDAINTRARLAEEIGNSRVVRDGEVKKAYDTYYAQEKRYDTYIVGYAEVYPAYMSSFATCVKPFQINKAAANNLTKLAGLHRTAAKPCLEDLSKVSKSSVTPLADYGKEFARIINERQKVFDAIEKKTLDEKTAGDRITELGNDYTKSDPTEALRNFVKDASFNGELNDFIKLLEDKAKAAK